MLAGRAILLTEVVASCSLPTQNSTLLRIGSTCVVTRQEGHSPGW